MNTLFFLGVTFGSYYLMAIIQTLLHRAFGHKDRIHPVYSAHALGHHAKYDGAEMQGDSYIDSEVHVMYYFAFPIAAVAAVAYLAGGVLALAGNLVGVVAAFWWHLHLHEQYHLIDSYLERFAWFQKKRSLHFVHHRNDRHNFAVVEFWIDSLIGTRKEI